MLNTSIVSWKGQRVASEIECRYNEEDILKEVSEYVLSTYKGHYVGKSEIQTVDIWDTLGSAETTCRDTAIKYLMRFGKKDGKNKKDLLKAIHYVILLIHYSGVMNEAHNGTGVEVDSNKSTKRRHTT